MGALFDLVAEFMIEFVGRVLICGVGRLVLGTFGGKLRISARTEHIWIVLTGLAVWTAIGFGIWWLLR